MRRKLGWTFEELRNSFIFLQQGETCTKTWFRDDKEPTIEETDQLVDLVLF